MTIIMMDLHPVNKNKKNLVGRTAYHGSNGRIRVTGKKNDMIGKIWTDPCSVFCPKSNRQLCLVDVVLT